MSPSGPSSSTPSIFVSSAMRRTLPILEGAACRISQTVPIFAMRDDLAKDKSDWLKFLIPQMFYRDGRGNDGQS
jgi:hypothetical protein